MPLMPLIDVVGSALSDAPAQIAATGLNEGVVTDNCVGTLNEALVAAHELAFVAVTV